MTDGTGISAQVKGLDLYGKTGTSEYGDHWFVGTIPENVCAVWYKSDKDAETDTADAARIWKGIFEKIGAGGCKETGVGYYKEGTFLELCKECQ